MITLLLKMCMTRCLAEDEGVSAPCGDECFICLHDYEKGDACIRISACGHVIHEECLKRVFYHGHRDCPLCRKPLRTILRIFSLYHRSVKT